MSERFFRTNRPGYSHPVCSELENSGIRVAVGDCSVTERRRWRPPYQTGKTVHVPVNTLQKRQRTHGTWCARPWFRTAEPLGERHYKNWITLTHTHTHAHTHTHTHTHTHFRSSLLWWKRWLLLSWRCLHKTREILE